MSEENLNPEAQPPESQPGKEGCACRRRAFEEPRGKLHAYNWLADISDCHDCEYVQVQFKNTRNGFYENPQHLQLEIGDLVAVEASPGHDIGRVAMVGRLVREQMKKANIRSNADIKKVFRKARPADIEKYKEAQAREHETMIRSRKIAEDLGLNMKIGDVEYQGDGAKAIFYYIADERVDFRKLIRILAETFHIRIEMKQIGARQEAGRIGGIGPCGRPLCCSTWMSHFVSVGTSAARFQDLSMNPQKLAGQCAKLKCCLNFEVDTYMEASRKMPPKDAVLQTKDGDYYQFKTDILRREITYSTDKGIPANLVTIPARRAFDIIALNRQGIKVDQLPADPVKEEPKKDYVDLVGQESLTRFDKSKKKKKKPKAKKPEEGAAQKQPAQQAQPKQQPKQPAKQPRQQNQHQPAPQGEPKPQKNRPANRNRQDKRPQPAQKQQPQQQPKAPRREGKPTPPKKTDSNE